MYEIIPASVSPGVSPGVPPGVPLIPESLLLAFNL